MGVCANVITAAVFFFLRIYVILWTARTTTTRRTIADRARERARARNGAVIITTRGNGTHAISAGWLAGWRDCSPYIISYDFLVILRCVCSYALPCGAGAVPAVVVG